MSSLYKFAIIRLHAPVAQLDRVPGYEPVGREFESLRARHLTIMIYFFYALLLIVFHHPEFISFPLVGFALRVTVTPAQAGAHGPLDSRFCGNDVISILAITIIFPWLLYVHYPVPWSEIIMLTLFMLSGISIIMGMDSRLRGNDGQGKYLLASIIFFWAWMNLETFMSGMLYPKTMTGFMECYVMALPFLKNSLIANALCFFSFQDFREKQLPFFRLSAPRVLDVRQ